MERINRERRTFLRRGAMGAGALWTFSLAELSARRAFERLRGRSPYGDVSPKIDQTTGLPLLQLPDGFRYLSYSWTGQRMSDGVLCPPAHDGMAVVDIEPASGIVTLVRNHECDQGAAFVDRGAITFSAGGAGGTTNLTFDTRRGEWRKAWSSLAGTARNCAGGVTPWGSWITAEETIANGHGWCFDVGSDHGDPTPLRDMGRFSHEALMIDPRTGHIYETEDAGANSGFYKFVPRVYGKLAQGGDLFMLKVRNVANHDFTTAATTDPRREWDVEWVRIDDPAALGETPFKQGLARGAAKFQRLEGAWWGHRTGYFLSTDGGPVREGQVFEYDPIVEKVRLVYHSASADDCDNPDNLTVTPRGGLLLCEDAARGTNIPAERLIGLSLEGQTFVFAANNIDLTGAAAINDHIEMRDHRGREFAGACFSPDGEWLFVNAQTPGVTFAITGPWEEGPL